MILCLAGLQFRFLSERPLDIDPALINFITPFADNVDITVRISWDWEKCTLPELPLLGEDLLCSYYRQGDIQYCLTRGGYKGPLACSVYGPACQEILCVLNEKPFLLPANNFGSILRMIPLRAALQAFHVLFFHASRICHNGKAIIFTAPSGTGKTTQAALWHKYRNAEILCNDRTLLRRMDGIWQSYGFPIDGSEPVRSSAVCPLGAVVLLAQGPENHVQSLRPGRAAGLLMAQMVIDSWNPDAKRAAMEGILSLLEEIPIYLLTCTPDDRAVNLLEQKLLEDEVFTHGNNF